MIITKELGKVLYNYLNTKPRGEVNDMCMALEQSPETDLSKVDLTPMAAGDEVVVPPPLPPPPPGDDNVPVDDDGNPLPPPTGG